MSEKLNCYTLVGGQFIGPDYTAELAPKLDKNGDPVIDRKTKQPVMALPSKVWNMKETVVSPHDLAARPGGQFVFKGPYVKNTPKGETPTTPATVVPPSATVPPTKSDFYREAELNEMTVADLTNLAAEEEIDLAGATKKADIVRTLLAARP